MDYPFFTLMSEPSDDYPHRRYNPLLDEWVLCSPGRLSRPWRGERSEPPRGKPARHDPDCYMCPGNRRAGGATNPDYDGVLAFDNEFPALRPGISSGPVEISHPLFRSHPERGRCRVLCFSPRHDLHLGTMAAESIRRVVDAWAEESATLSCAEGIGYVQIFENRGAMMGASNPHPHGQIWAVGQVPSLPARKAAKLASYWDSHQRDLLGDYLDEEVARNERVVATSDYFIQVVPYWAVWPFETMLLPRRRVRDLSELDDAERRDLAHVVRSLTSRYDRLFETPFPYSMAWYQAPCDGRRHEGFRLHASYFPPLVRSAQVRKYLVGYELSAEPQRDIAPEEAAARLRSVSVESP
jgi:UDPglucose--hexose-1-phosphate uridylyltransferase